MRRNKGCTSTVVSLTNLRVAKKKRERRESNRHFPGEINGSSRQASMHFQEVTTTISGGMHLASKLQNIDVFYSPHHAMSTPVVITCLLFTYVPYA